VTSFGASDPPPTSTPSETPGRVPLSDAGQRDLIRTALDRTLVVEAAAGTGKTTELVRRIVAILASGRAELDRVVAVTFTEPAAGELKLRLRMAIEEGRLDVSRPPVERERLKASLPKLEEARIGTIHSFCVDLLRERPVEAGVDPFFEVAADDVARPLFERAFDRWFEAQLANPSQAVRRILRRWKRESTFGTRQRDRGPRGLLRQAAWQLVEHRDFPERWRREVGFERDATLDELLEVMESLAVWGARTDADEWFGKSLIEIAKATDEVRRAERVQERDYDWLEAWVGELVRQRHWSWKGWRRWKNPDFPIEELLPRRNELHARLSQFVDDAGADLAPLLRDDLLPVVEAYESAKRDVGCLDFDDLLIRARDLLRTDAGVRREMQHRYTHYFVDEFQDTDPIQVEILMLLAADDSAVTDWRAARATPGKFFLVGDPKQSIYRFRRANVEMYRDVYRRLVEQGATPVNLTVNFRSVPEIQEAVNAAFAPRMGGTEGGYVPLARFRESHNEQPALIALPVPGPYGDFGTIFEPRIEASLPDVVGAWVNWLVNESGWTVTERGGLGERVKVEPRHVCLLFKRFKSFLEDVTRPYVAALEARQLPHLLVGGSSFHDREEIEALRNALAAIERPDDELAVFATLRGPLLAVSDAALLIWREQVGALHPFRPVPDDLPPSLAEVAEGLALLRTLHRGRNRRPAADTIARLLEETRAHAAFAIWHTGAQALANVGRLMDLARRAEQHGVVSFRGFVERLENEAERGDVAEAPLLEEGVEGVRIMTAHRAKGLEFPIVVLADMTANETFQKPMRWTDAERGLCVQRLAGCTPPELREHGEEEMEREREEAVRLLYVAATRARDVLVVPVIGDTRHDGWLTTLHSVVHPAPARARSPISREFAGAPAFSEDSVPHRPDNVARPFGSVMPGLHQPEAGSHRVAWWDPAVLTLGVRPTMGLSQTRILEADGGGRGEEALSQWEAWRDARTDKINRGGTASRVVSAATDWAQRTVDVAGVSEIEVVDARTMAERPAGPRFGTLVHALLATVGLDEDHSRIAEHAEVQARILGASESDRDAAVECVAAALGHPLLLRAAAAIGEGRCRREVAVVARLDDGALLEGVADLAFLEGEEWIVVDFKTDASPEPQLAIYRRQVALYVRSIAEATSAPARGYLLLV